MRVFTNEDATAHALSRAGLPHEALAWRDRLAFGPLSAKAREDAFVELRASAFEAAGWDEYRVAAADFRLWFDGVLDVWESGEEIALVFGASLADQLKIGWIVDWIASRHATRAREARLILERRDPSGLEGDELLELLAGGEPIGARRVDGYRRFWRAAAGDDPSVWAGLMADLRAAPELEPLAAAAERWLQEFPSADNGLSLTECQILDAIALGVGRPLELFEAAQATEELPFRCDWEFWSIVDRLACGDAPLVGTDSGKAFLCPPKALAWEEFRAQRLVLTGRGEAALRGGAENAAAGLPQRWLGGALLGGATEWRYRYGTRALERLEAEPAGAR